MVPTVSTYTDDRTRPRTAGATSADVNLSISPLRPNAYLARPRSVPADERGRRLPKNPCPKCGANVGPMPLRVEHLRHLGWQPYTVRSYQSWCGHTQEVIPFPREDGSVLFVEVMGEAH